MYFFACDLDKAPYGIVRGSCKRGDFFETAYKWLAQYCQFFPPLFVSTDQSRLSGYLPSSDKIVFGFKSISNIFPVDYNGWVMISGILLNLDTNNFRLIDERLVEGLKELQSDGEVDLSKYHNLDDFLKRNVFVNKEQFAVQSLDLRRAYSILCSNEIQKATLTRKGFQSGQIKIVSSFSRSSLVQS